MVLQLALAERDSLSVPVGNAKQAQLAKMEQSLRRAANKVAENSKKETVRLHHILEHQKEERAAEDKKINEGWLPANAAQPVQRFASQEQEAGPDGWAAAEAMSEEVDRTLAKPT